MLRGVIIVAVEFGLVAAAAAAGYLCATWIAGFVASMRGLPPDAAHQVRRRARTIAAGALGLLSIGILLYNGALIVRGADVWDHTLGLVSTMSVELWIEAAVALGKLAAACVAVVVATRLIGRGLRWVEASLNRWDRLKDNDRSLDLLVTGLDRAIAVAAWMLLAVYALRVFRVPDAIVSGLVMIIRAYVVIAVGMLVVRSSVVIVDTLDGLSHRYAQTHGWLRYYDALRGLLPTFRRCLEYALWIVVASLALVQLGAPGRVTAWGPRLIQAIGLVFLAAAIIELGRLEITRQLLPRENLDEMTRRRRETIAPLVRSSYVYAVYFGAAVLILASLGFNPLPFLAGAGILGLVVGFGAQSLINDVVSGFFILFENTYLVGDAIEAADAKGVVEAIEFRTTKIRDDDGRLHVIRNGDVKQVINYSKDYALAVVPVNVVYDADLPVVFAILREAGERVRADNPDMLGEMQIDGITAFGAKTMTVRTSTRVRPGRHDAVAAALRLSIKEAFDRHALSSARRGLVPAKLASTGSRVSTTI